MKSMIFYPKALGILTLILFAFFPTYGQNDVLYREVFPLNSAAGSDLEQAVANGWEGYRHDNVKIEENKVKLGGGGFNPTEEEPINSNFADAGQGRSYLFWGFKNSLGFSVYTDEIESLGIPSANLKSLRWTNRNNNDGSSSVDAVDDFRALIRVNDVFYASVATYPIGNTPSGVWEDENFDISTTQWIPMYICVTTNPDRTGKTIGGPRLFGGCGSQQAAEDLPEGILQSVGFFLDRTQGRLRISNFEMVGITPPPQELPALPFGKLAMLLAIVTLASTILIYKLK